MEESYKGFRKPYVLVLYAKADAQQITEIVEGLQSRKIAVDYSLFPKKNEIARATSVIALLSQQFYEDARAMKTLSQAIAMGMEIIPVSMDQAKRPDVLNMELYSVHSLSRERYASSEKLVEQIISATSLQHMEITKKQKQQFKIIATVIAAVAMSVVLVTTATVAVAKARQKQIMVSYGISQEEMESYENVMFIGDRFINMGTDRDIWLYVYDIWEDNNENIFYLLEDGSKVPQGSISDFSILKQMTNLRTITIINQPAEKIPNLSAFKYLEEITIMNTDTEDLSFLEGSKIHDCRLRSIAAVDLSPLSRLENMNYCELMAMPITSVNFSSEALTSINICNCLYLTDISDLAKDGNLQYLYMNANSRLEDISPLYDLTSLEEVTISCSPVRDLTGMENKPNLRNLELCDLEFMDVNFLKNLGRNHLDQLLLNSRCPDPEAAVDFSGLQALNQITEFELSCNGRDYSIISPYITQLYVGSFIIGHANNIDFSKLPQNMNVLGLCGYLKQDLTDLPLGLTLQGITIKDSERLQSLNGLERISGLKSVNICECYRLRDFDALYKLDSELESLTCARSVALPDFTKVTFSNFATNVEIENMLTTIDDISFLGNLKNGEGGRIIHFNSIKFKGVLDIRGLNILFDEELTVDYMELDYLLFDAAQEMKAEKNANTDIRYRTENIGNFIRNDFKLQSLDEIKTLPAVALKGVQSIKILGAKGLPEWEQYRLTETENDGTPTYLIVEESFDLQDLMPLENLQSMDLVNVQVDNFNHIQAFPQLREMHMNRVKAEDLGILDLMLNLEVFDMHECEELEGQT